MYAPHSLRRRLSAAVLSLALGHASAQAITPSRATDAATTTARASQATSTDHTPARDWGLDAQEWTRYQDLVQGPLGIYSPNLDPLTALGIAARTDAERNHYAEMQVRAEAQRVQRELTYQQAYDAAWKRLYPQLQAIQLPSDRAAPATATATSGAGRLAIFVKDGCATCDARIRQLQQAGAPFDIYVVGTQQDDTRIRAWAAHVGLDAAKVRSGAITLNHDAGRWLSLGQQGDLPAEVRTPLTTGASR